jgi:two-component system cell cycle sensor histidine kinase/response regulator CckA
MAFPSARSLRLCGRAVPIALHNRDHLFSGAPVVSVAVDRSAATNLRLEAAVTGTWMHQGWGETLDLARRLHPGTRRAVVVVGSTRAERFYVEAAREQLSTTAGSIEVGYLVAFSLEQLRRGPVDRGRPGSCDLASS